MADRPRRGDGKKNKPNVDAMRAAMEKGLSGLDALEASNKRCDGRRLSIFLYLPFKKSFTYSTPSNPFQFFRRK